MRNTIAPKNRKQNSTMDAGKCHRSNRNEIYLNKEIK